MLLDLSEVELSKNDLKREIKLPKIFTLELAEDVDIGGDGKSTLPGNEDF